MRIAPILPFSLLLLLSGCATEPKPAPAPAKKAVTRPLDERHRFPRENQLKTELADDHVLGKDFLPGGNVAHYRKGAQNYELLLIKTSDPTTAAILLLDYKKKLDNAKVIPSFGGYFGEDGARPTFVFAKSAWLCGVIGLGEAEADAVARDFASRLP